MFAKLVTWFRNHINAIRIANLEEQHRKDVKAFLNRIDQWGLTVRKNKVVGYVEGVSISNDDRLDLELEYRTMVWEHQQALKALR